ncbi:aldehyde dehydrogenase [Candidatus Daviesbacteria bacterium]|nr:aldehyde dehydrogenase [Candidatus Levybacteria bacterium]MBI2601374.1 aldehyde dehydrogenase [Candidatus Daviesbacteria bacterium]
MKLISKNPSKNYEILGEVNVSSKKEVKKAVVAARNAFLAWANLSLDTRCRYIKSFLDVSRKRKEEISQFIAKETGRPITSARANVEGGFEYFEAYIKMADKYLLPQVTYESGKEVHKILREPRGVIAAILPWNYPYMNISWQCGQALIAGNTIVYKNSEENPLFSQLIAELIEKSDIPKGVFNVLYGNGEVGDYLVHQDIDMISFTGSTKVGQELTKIAAEKFIPIVAELGGSSPLILFEDIEITDEIISYIAGRRFENAGQACDAVKRLIVHKSKFNEVVEKLSAYVSKQKVGDALDENTEIGPLIAKRQVDLIDKQVQDSIKNGADVVIGGKKSSKLQGAYYLPTILTNIERSMRVWKEETFGPVLPVISFATEKEAINLANDTEYGLTAHILTNDKALFLRVSSKINAGSIAHNQTEFWSPLNPFGGYKKSGMGRTHGPFGFYESTQVKVISMEK